MDEIQRVLVKLGRKDLAQKYYEKVSNDSDIASVVKKSLHELNVKTIKQDGRTITFKTKEDPIAGGGKTEWIVTTDGNEIEAQWNYINDPDSGTSETFKNIDEFAKYLRSDWELV